MCVVQWAAKVIIKELLSAWEGSKRPGLSRETFLALKQSTLALREVALFLLSLGFEYLNVPNSAQRRRYEHHFQDRWIHFEKDSGQTPVLPLRKYSYSWRSRRQFGIRRIAEEHQQRWSDYPHRFLL